ncbi:MAG: PH domain-containing protein [Myxococcota bacterium]
MVDDAAPEPPEAFRPLDPRARVLFHVQALVTLVVAWTPMVVGLTAVGAVMVDPRGAMIVGACLWFALFLVAVWWPSLSYDRYGWAITADELVVRQGVLFRVVAAIPLARVQHVDVRQGPVEQWLGLARVHVHTASGVGADGVIPGLALAEAESVRDRLVAGARADDGV